MFKENDDLIINLTVTPHCYARCKDCINNHLTFCGDNTLTLSDLESEPERDALLIVKIAEKHPHKEVTVCFYGGEPFLKPDKMDHIRLQLEKSAIRRRVRYMVYTTGEFIRESVEKYPSLIRNMWLYSISVDGSAKQHERVRPGTSLASTINSLEELRKVYDGNILAWSTLREEQSLLDCFLQFISMYRCGLAGHFFWHWADSKQPLENFKQYSSQYKQELDEIMNQYVSWISDGEILPISHVNELLLFYLEGKQRGHTACAVELAQNYDILGGRVHACADLPSSYGAFGYGGSVDIPSGTLESLVLYKEKLGCRRCGVHWYCGGRCPVQAIVGSPERTKQVCELMRLHVNTIKRHLPNIQKMLLKHHISTQQIYDSSAFIARYTDVVP